MNIHASVAGDHSVRSLERALRSAQKLLGPARDADVVRKAVLACPVRTNAEKRKRDALAEALSKRAATARKIAAVYFRSAAWRAVSARVKKLLTKSESAEGISEEKLRRIGRAAMRRAGRKVCRRYRELGRASSTRLHRLRIAVRKYRYTSEFFVPWLGAEARAAARAAKRLQDILGDIHDADIVLALLKEEAEADVSGIVKEWADRRNRLISRFERVWKTKKPFIG